MYLIYLQNIKNYTIRVLEFSSTMEKAKYKINELSSNFIVENEGRKKLDIVYQEENFDYNKLPDGYYLVKKENLIDVYHKTSNITELNGWFGLYHNIEHKCEKVEIYKFTEFDSNLLNPFIYTSNNSSNIITKKPEIITNNKISNKTTKVNSFDDVIKQLVSTGFTQRLKKTRL
jgi:hypothetical protein